MLWQRGLPFQKPSAQRELRPPTLRRALWTAFVCATAGCASGASLRGWSASAGSDALVPAVSLRIARPEPGETKTAPAGPQIQATQPHGPRPVRFLHDTPNVELTSSQHLDDRGDPLWVPPNEEQTDSPTRRPADLPAEAPLRTGDALTRRLSARDDLRGFAPSVGRDLRALWNWETAGVLAVGLGASIAVRETVDDDVNDWTLESPHRWGDGNDFFSVLGNPGHHFAAAGLLWGTSLLAQDPELHEMSGALVNALVLTNLSTWLLKVAADTDTPNGENLGWPSGHTSSSVAVAAVLDEYYGPWVGIPAYGLAGLVAWSRIDDREHDLSDVIFGAALGYAIGKTVAANHHCKPDGMQLVPYVDPAEGTTGIGLEKRY